MQEVLQIRTDEGYREEDDIQVVAFNLGNEEYAVDILYVQEINRLLNITRVPRAGEHIEGVINLRGNIIPIINLHTRFNLSSSGSEDDKRIIVFQFEDLKVGIIVDQVSEVLRIKQSEIEPASKVYGTVETDHIQGIAKVGDRLMILLDLAKII